MKIKKSIPAIHKDIMKQVNEFEVKYSQLQPGAHHQIMTEFEEGKLTDFVLNLQEKLGQPTDKIKLQVSALCASTLGEHAYSSFVIEKGWTRVFNLSTEDYRLDIIDSKIDNTVEIWWIEANQKGQGTGTMLINNILDAADEIGVNVKAIPVPINCGKKKYAYDSLRDWYESFGFERAKSPIDPSVTYYA